MRIYVNLELKELKGLNLTKGDNHPMDDLELYARGQTHLDREEEIIGLVEGFVPCVGMLTIWMNKIKWIKYSVIGGLGLLAALLHK